MSTASSGRGSAAEDFGPLLAEVRVLPGYLVVCAVLAIGFLAAAAVVGTSGGTKGTIYAFFFALAGVVVLGVAGWSFQARLRVYEHGIIRRNLLGQTRMRYDEVETIWLSGPRNLELNQPLSQTTLVGGGREFRADFPAYGKTARAVRLALDRILEHLGPQAVERMRGGDILSLGQAQVAWPGLMHRGRTIRWEEIEHMGFGRDGLRIFPRNRPQDTIVLNLRAPNLPLLTWLGHKMPALVAAEQTALKAAAGKDRERLAEPVYGFPEADPDLGPLLCGSPRRPGLVYASLAAAGLILGVSAVLYGRSGPGQVAALAGAWLLLFLGCAVAGVAWFDFRWRGFAIYEQGVRTPRGPMRWEECDHVTYAEKQIEFHGLTLGRYLSLTLQGRAPRVRIVGSGPSTEGFCMTVLDRVMPVLVARRIQELHDGHRLRIGPVMLTSEGLVHKRVALPWREIQAIDVRGDRLWVWRYGREKPVISVDVNRRDVQVFFALVRQMLIRGTEDATPRPPANDV